MKDNGKQNLVGEHVIFPIGSRATDIHGDKGVIVEILTDSQMKAMTEEERRKIDELALNAPPAFTRLARPEIYHRREQILTAAQALGSDVVINTTDGYMIVRGTLFVLKKKSAKGRKRLIRSVQKRMMLAHGEDRKIIRGILKALKKYDSQQTITENAKRSGVNSRGMRLLNLEDANFSSGSKISFGNNGTLHLKNVAADDCLVADQQLGKHVLDDRGVLGFVPDEDCARDERFALKP